MEQRSKYTYNGPVFVFGKHMARIKLEVWATSPDKAYHDMVSQAESQLDYPKNTKITLVKGLIKKEELKYGTVV